MKHWETLSCSFQLATNSFPVFSTLLSSFDDIRNGTMNATTDKQTKTTDNRQRNRDIRYGVRVR